MHWIEKRIHEWQERTERRQRVDKEAPKIFDGLWKSILDDIRVANQTGYLGVLQIGTEGNAPLRDMTIYRPAPRQRQEVHVRMTDDRFRIDVSGIVRLVFLLRICADDSVCLQDKDGNRVEIYDAAKAILDPLLFPELQKEEFPTR